MHKINIGVTGIGSVIGQAIIKSLRASEFKDSAHIIGFDYFKGTIGSHWVDKELLLPDVLKKETSEESWLDKLLEYIKMYHMALIFIGLDFELKLFSKFKTVIESKTGCKVIVSGSKVIEIADDKYLTYNFLKDNGLYFPETVLPGELDHAHLSFPVILKPRFGWRSRNVFIVKNESDLMMRLPLVEYPIIQELIGTPDDEYTCGVLYLDNKLKGVIVLKRYLKDGGTITASFSKDIPRIIYDYISAISDKLQPFGSCNFQLRLSSKGIPKVFEINARHSGTTYMRALFGFNEIEYLVAYFLRLPIKEFELREGTVKRYYDEMFLKKV